MVAFAGPVSPCVPALTVLWVRRMRVRQVGDAMELKAIKSRFADLDYQPYVGSTKSLSGHSLGAAGVQEVSP